MVSFGFQGRGEAGRGWNWTGGGEDQAWEEEVEPRRGESAEQMAKQGHKVKQQDHFSGSHKHSFYLSCVAKCESLRG